VSRGFLDASNDRRPVVAHSRVAACASALAIEISDDFFEDVALFFVEILLLAQEQFSQHDKVGQDQ
jgi:hypothetical protein